MANVRILWNNLIDLTTVKLSADSAESPVSHLKVARRTKVWRSTARSAVLTIDLSASSNINAIAVTGYNLTSLATISIAHSSDNITYTGIETKTVGTLTSVLFFFTLIQDRYWQITLTDTTNESPYIEVGRVFIGTYFEPEANLHTNWSVEIVDESTSRRSAGLQKWRTNKVPFSRVTFRLPHLTQSEAFQNFIDILIRIGIKTDIFLSLFPEGNANQKTIGDLYGRFIGVPGVTNPAIGAYATDQLIFEENNEKD